MNSDNRHKRLPGNEPPTRQCRTARFNLPIKAPGVWRFLFNQLFAPAMRLHRFRTMSTRMIEEALDQVDGRRCQ